MTEAWGKGHLVAGKYRLVDKLGEGGMGVVWRADHLTLLSQVALKLVSQSVLATPEGLARFMIEAQAAALIRSPHVVQILDHGVDDGVPYMAMELLEGESLSTRLARMRTLSPAETARLLTHVARAMTKAHDAGIVHRDLKPDNIFLVQNDDEELAKVLDFGIAKIAHGLSESTKDLSTRSGALLGTPYYMSPEQVRGHKLDHRTDLWSLAVITFECLVGRTPFDAETVGDLLLQICTGPSPVFAQQSALPAGFEAWIARGLARPREDRFQSAREMADALRALVADLPASSAAGRLAVPSPSLSALDAATLAHSAHTLLDDPAAGAAPRSSPLPDVTQPALDAAPTVATSLLPPSSDAMIGGPSERDPARAPARSRASRSVAVAVLLGVGTFAAVLGLTHRWTSSAPDSAALGGALPSPSTRVADPLIHVVPGAPVSSDAVVVAAEAPIPSAVASSARPSRDVATTVVASPARSIAPIASIAKPLPPKPPEPPAEPAAVPPKKKDELAF
jgi:serine/threonine-protein kinase